MGHPTYAHAYAWGRDTVEPYDWTIAFEKRVRELLVAEETNPLIDYENRFGAEAMLVVSTPDHYLPLLYVDRGASEPGGGHTSRWGVDGGITCVGGDSYGACYAPSGSAASQCNRLQPEL